MYAFDIIIKNDNPEYENFISDCYSYVYFLQRTGQVVERKQIVVLKGNIITIPVICPEKKSFDLKYCSKYNLKTIKKIEESSGNKIEHILKGREAEGLAYEVSKKSSFYILRNGWNSPLICGDTETGIPLYRIAKTDHNGDDYDNIYFWNRDYERLHGLWLSSGAYEAFVEEELQSPLSSINKRGREICKIIEKITSVPTYYFLHNYRGWSKEEDRQRKCPITGNDWIIEGKTSSHFIAFKCEESRLVSELSINSDCEDKTL